MVCERVTTQCECDAWLYMKVHKKLQYWWMNDSKSLTTGERMVCKSVTTHHQSDQALRVPRKLGSDSRARGTCASQGQEKGKHGPFPVRRYRHYRMFNKCDSLVAIYTKSTQSLELLTPLHVCSDEWRCRFYAQTEPSSHCLDTFVA
jgi:hypothetical protein